MKRLITAVSALAAAFAASGATVKWTGSGDGSKWSDTANWENGASVDFTARNVYDLSDATSGSTLLNDTATNIGGLTLGSNQGTITLSSSVTAKYLSGTWTVPAATTLVLQQAYNGPWSDYNATTLAGGGTVRIESSTFTANYLWTVKDSTTLELAKGLSDMKYMQLSLTNNAVLKVLASGTVLAELDVDATSRVELGANTLTLCGGLVTSYKKRGAIRGAVTGTGSLVFAGAKTLAAETSITDFTGSLTLKNASLAFGNGCLLGDGVGLTATSSGILTLGGSQSFSFLSGTGTSGGLRVPAGAVATVTGSGVSDGGTMLFREAVRGDGGLALDAAGKTLVLNGVNSYKGPTQVTAGTLTMRNAGAVTYPDGLLNGLLVRYSFDESISYDSSTNANDLTKGSTVQPDQAAGGLAGSSCVTFSRADKNNKRMWLQSAAGVPLTGLVPFTLSLWIRPSLETVTNGYYIVGGKNGETMHYSFCFVKRATVESYNLKDTLNVNGMGWVNLNIDTVGKWTHLAMTQDTTGYRKFYVNGVLRKSGDDKGAIRESDSTLSGEPLRLGGLENGWDACFDGEMDEVLMFSRELSAAEVASLYASPFQDAATASLPEPVAHWAFDDAEAPGKDEKGLLALSSVGDGTAAVASTDGTWGSAFASDSDTASYLAYTGDFPAGFPTGASSFTVSIRMAVGNGKEGVAPFAFGDLATNGSFFRLGATQRPSLIAFTTQNTGADNTFQAQATDGTYYHSYASPEEESALSHYVFSYDATRKVLKCYLDGLLTKTYANLTITLPTSGSVYVGYRPDALQNCRFRGLVDDVQVFGCALSGEDVRALTRKLHFGAAAGRAASPDSAVTVASGATVRFEGPGHSVGSLAGAGRVEVAPSASVALAGVSAFAGELASEGSLTLADGCVIALDATKPTTPALTLAGTVALPANAVVRVADDAARAGTRTFKVLAADGFTGEANLSGWTVANAPEGSYKFVVKDGCVCLKFRLGGVLVIR